MSPTSARKERVPAWQLHVDQRPAAVAYPQSAQDVVNAVRSARERGQRVAAQATGHNAAPLGSLHDTLLLRTDRMRGVTIDAQARIARADAGARSLEVVQAAAAHGLATVARHLAGRRRRRLHDRRRHRPAQPPLRAGGEQGPRDRARHRRRPARPWRTASEEPDLFWALRGGGGSFGVVTAIELELFRLAEAYAGALWFPVERAGEVMHAWRELTQAALPDELSTLARLLRFPPVPEVPEQLRGASLVIVDVYHAGAPAQADELLAPLRALGPVNDSIRVVTMPELSRVHMDPEQPVPGVGDGVMLAELPAEALAALIGVAGEQQQLAVIELRHLEGALGRARPEHGALASIPAKYVLAAGGFAPTPELVTAVSGQVEAVQQALAPWTAPYLYLNFSDISRDPASFWEADAYQRLRRVKSAVDPGDLIRSNHPIPPATAPTR